MVNAAFTKNKKSVLGKRDSQSCEHILVFAFNENFVNKQILFVRPFPDKPQHDQCGTIDSLNEEEHHSVSD